MVGDTHSAIIDKMSGRAEVGDDIFPSKNKKPSILKGVLKMPIWHVNPIPSSENPLLFSFRHVFLAN